MRVRLYRMLLYDLITYQVPVEKIRLGTDGDGGYVIIPSMKYDLFLSAGLCDNVQFENDFLTVYKNTPCYAFDGTIQGLPPSSNPGIQWIKKNIGLVNSDRETNLHEYLNSYRNIFVKMDIEGSEFDWMESCSKEQLETIKQLVIEVHWPISYEKWSAIYSRLTETHWLVHVHGNNHCGCFYMENRPIPEVLELTYIRKKDWPVLNKNTRGFPWEEVDRKNYPTNDEHGLRGFPFEFNE